MSDNKATFESQMQAFIERRLAVLRPQIAALQAEFKASLSGGAEADEETARLFCQSLPLRLEYTQLLAESERFGSGNTRWISPAEHASQAPPPEIPATPQPAQRQPMGFRKSPEPSAD